MHNGGIPLYLTTSEGLICYLWYVLGSKRTGKLVADSTGIPGKYRFVTLDELDGRTLAAKRARQLVDDFTSDLGGDSNLSTAERELIQRAAILGTILGNYEAHWLVEGAVPLGEYLPCVNAQKRVLETLGLQRRPRDVTPSLATYLKERTQ